MELGDFGSFWLKANAAGADTGDAAKADRTFDMASAGSAQRLMGDTVDPRKRFIQTHAKAVRNLDI